MEAELKHAEERIATFGTAHQMWILPILLTLEDLGGRARPKSVREKVRGAYAAHLSDDQWTYVVENGRLGWTRLGLKHVNLLAGEHGWWVLTSLGRAYLEAHRGDPVSIPDDLPSKKVTDDAGDGPATEVVPATDFEAYERPLLDAMSRGLTAKPEILDDLLQAVQSSLLPGDLRQMKGGKPVWAYRANWGLTNLKQKGLAKNTGRGMWETTEAGREQLDRDRDTWSIEKYQHSKANVVIGETEPPKGGPGPTEVTWSIERWQAAAQLIGPELFGQIHQRLRPDLSPTPSSEKNYVARSVVLYGPPGTGKTYLARAAARALTGDDEPGPDSRWRIVQFHPSYAYEDFIQGLKPDLEKKDLRYVLRQGPFLELCQAAEDDPDEFFVLIIDEINRGDPARIFGELLYALEYRGQPVDLPLGGQLTVPPNLVIIGTMNSVDRSVALVDYALRRRFGFVRISPDPDVIIDTRGEQPLAQVAAMVLQGFNGWVAQRLDQEHALGHSFFLNPAIPLDDEAALQMIWQLDVYPLLEEYFFGEPESLAEARQEWDKAVASALQDLSEAVEDEVGVDGEEPGS